MKRKLNNPTDKRQLLKRTTNGYILVTYKLTAVNATFIHKLSISFCTNMSANETVMKQAF